MTTQLQQTDYDLWIDGVGVYRIVFSDRLTIGSPGGKKLHRLSLLAPLSSEHAVIERVENTFRLQANGPTTVNGVHVTEASRLGSNAEIRLKDSVSLQFSVPSALCRTAVLHLPEASRSTERLDGVIMMDELCLIGSRSSCHIDHADVEPSLALFCERGEFFVSSVNWNTKGGKLNSDVQPVNPGVAVTFEELRFRLAETETTSKLMASLRK